MSKLITDKQMRGLLAFLDVDLIQIKEAAAWLEKNGMEPREIQIPNLKILGFDVVFSNCLNPNVTAYPINNLHYSVGIKNQYRPFR